jgi:hypothetical protein
MYGTNLQEDTPHLALYKDRSADGVLFILKKINTANRLLYRDTERYQQVVCLCVFQGVNSNRDSLLRLAVLTRARCTSSGTPEVI